MEFMAGVVALVKLIAAAVMFIMLIYGIAVEADPKRKFTELVTSVILFSVLMSLQFVVPKMAGQNADKLKQIVTSWDPSPLFQAGN